MATSWKLVSRIVQIHGEISAELWKRLFVRARAGTAWSPL